MLFGGTLCTSGAATAVVVTTGARTELGKISEMLRETTDLATPLTRDLAKIGRIITVGIVVIASLMLALGTARAMVATGAPFSHALRETVIFAVALAVGAIPEGLPAIVTIALAIGVQRMAARRAVVRRLPAVETLGSTTVICSDKTGTLTRNEMTVQARWTPVSGELALTGVGYASEGELRRGEVRVDEPSADVRELFLAGALCNDATVTRGDDGRWNLVGDPTKAALVVAAEKVGVGVTRRREAFPRLDAIPFESEHQFMATLHARDGGWAVVKGAPEAVLRRCEGANGAPLDGSAVLAEVEGLAARGMRVLAVASKPLPGVADLTDAHVAGGLTLLGLQAMIDPPRAEAIEAIARCHAAGIRVKMITGDHKLTASAIGRALNIAGEGDEAVTGAAIAAMDDRALDEAVASRNVFARVAPEHKLRLVRALQRRGEVVAMTGDGVNDAPALKQADIGVAMGITGTSVSKESAEIVLADDNFASIAAAVEEGRRVYDNLIKSLAFVLPTNLGLALIREACVRADTVTTLLSQPPRGPHHGQPPPTPFAHETGRVGSRCFGATRLRGWA
jgi:Ca2+-transporting ATPase